MAGPISDIKDARASALMSAPFPFAFTHYPQTGGPGVTEMRKRSIWIFDDIIIDPPSDEGRVRISYEKQNPEFYTGDNTGFIL